MLSLGNKDMVCAGRVGSAFAAELGTMQVSEQTDSLRVLGTDPVDYLISPRVLACMIAAPILNIMCFAMGRLPTVAVTFESMCCLDTQRHCNVVHVEQTCSSCAERFEECAMELPTLHEISV